MHLPHGSPESRGGSPPSLNLYHALVGVSTNSTIAPIGFRMQSDTGLLGESTGGRISWNRACSFVTGDARTLQIKFPESDEGPDHDRPPLKWTDTPTQSFSERGFSPSSMYRPPRLSNRYAF